MLGYKYLKYVFKIHLCVLYFVFVFVFEMHSDVLVCALLTALSIPYSQTTWNSVAGSVCLSVRTVFQNASSLAFLVRLSGFFNMMVPYLGKIILLHGFLIRAL